MLTSIIGISYGTCCAAHLLAICMLLASRAQNRFKALLLVACALTAAWSTLLSVGPFNVALLGAPAPTGLIFEPLRATAWMIVTGYVLVVAYKKVVDVAVAVTFVTVTLLSMLLPIGVAVGWIPDVAGLLARQSGMLALVLAATSGLVLAENLFRNGGQEARWAVKYLCFASGGMFAYDLVMYAEASLLGRLDETLYAARGFVDAIMAPLVIIAAARSKSWPIDVHVSRRIVFHSAAILMVGLYLIGMAVVGYSLRILNSDWGDVARVVFLAVAVVALAALAWSESLRTRFKNFVNHNFFTHRYDYRAEWLRLIAAISENPADVPIPDRILRSLAALLDCTAGALWVHVEEDATYRLSATWNIQDLPPNIAVHDALPVLLAGTLGVVDVNRGRVDGRQRPETLPAWIAQHPRAWLAVPLVHARGLVAFAVIGHPRAEREPDWEDFELLKTAGRQAASYIAEDQAATSLTRARRFEDFNRQFAFVVHDIKNLAGQMSLILRNAERHGSNPRFQEDVLATVADSLNRMHALLDQLKQRRAANAPLLRLDLAATLRSLAVTWGGQIGDFELQIPETPLEIVGDSQRISTILNHLLQNAVDAAGPHGRVLLKGWFKPATQSPVAEAVPGGWAVAEVADSGPGMTHDFIENELFKPFDSTKSSGFGIGAYQVRHLVGEMGGYLDVDSTLGKGTRMIVRFPMAPAMPISESHVPGMLSTSAAV